MKIVFMGTPDYAAVTLQKLINEKFNIAAVFAQPDKPVGRKHILTPPPVKVCAMENGIEVFQPETFKDGKAAEILREIAPDVIVVVAYGKILPQEVLDIPKLGCVNGHASLLPKYRGASPIQWCIVCGEKVTGVTTMLMDKGMDTGDILETAQVEIGEEETGEELFDRLSFVSADLMVSTIRKLEKEEITPKPQNHDKATYAPIIKKEMALIDFNKTATEVHNAIRGYYSWPCAYLFRKGKRIKVISARVGDSTDAPANTVIGNGEELVVACGNGTSIRLLTLQPEGSKPMSAKQMLCGNPVEIGEMFGDMNG